MKRSVISNWSLDRRFGAIKKVVAKFLGIRRLGAGCDFHDSTAAGRPLAAPPLAAPPPLIGKRGYNMGDLWREPSDNESSTEDNSPHMDNYRAPHEAVSVEKR